MKRLLLSLLLTMTPALLSAAEPLATQPLFVSGEAGYGRYRIPALIATRAGTLLALCEGRVKPAGLTGDIDLVLRRSTDGGRSWLPQQTIADLGADTLGNPCPVVDRATGTIWLPFTRSPGAFTEQQIIDGQSSAPTSVWMIHSTDDGVSWSEPREISASTRRDDWTWYGTGPGISIQLRSGRLLVPAYHAEAGSKIYRSHMIYSDDHGASWQLGETVGTHTAECQVAERRDGTVVLNMRGTNQQGYRTLATSRDGGVHWSEPALDKNLPEPACQAALLALRGDRDTNKGVWLFCNPPGPTKRRDLTLRLSRDEGASWPVVKIIHAGPAEYCCLVQLADGRIGVLYEMSRAGEKYRPELHFTTVALDGLMNDK